MNKISISKDRLERGIYWERSLELVPGCSPVSEGCIQCWSAQQTHMRSFQRNTKIRERYAGLTDEKGNWTGEIRLREDLLDLPLRVKNLTVWSIWNDLFHEDVPFKFIDEVLIMARRCPNHIFLILTKRPGRMLEYYKYIRRGFVNFENNMWLGVTAENQRTTDERIPILLQIPAAVRFVSVEPMLERINLFKYFINKYELKISWVICGAESGSKRRPCNIEWVRSIKDQCQSAGIPLFIKQLHKIYYKKDKLYKLENVN